MASVVTDGFERMWAEESWSNVSLSYPGVCLGQVIKSQNLRHTNRSVGRIAYRRPEQYEAGGLLILPQGTVGGCRVIGSQSNNKGLGLYAVFHDAYKTCAF